MHIVFNTIITVSGQAYHESGQPATFVCSTKGSNDRSPLTWQYELPNGNPGATLARCYQNMTCIPSETTFMKATRDANESKFTWKNVTQHLKMICHPTLGPTKKFTIIPLGKYIFLW